MRVACIENIQLGALLLNGNGKVRIGFGVKQLRCAGILDISRTVYRKTAEGLRYDIM